VVRLSDYQIQTCSGCKVCFDKGEEYCPLEDDRDMLIEKIEMSDGVVFASPNYAFQASAIMKTFIERIGFALHRPRFFGKTFTSIVAQGVYGGGKIVDYMDLVGNGLGFNTVKGSVITTLEPMTEKQRQKNDRVLERLAERFSARLEKPAYPVPTLFKLMVFRMSRTSMRLQLDEGSRDYTYYAEKGWFESDYYYPVRLGVLKSAAGKLLDWTSARMAKAR
jgi:NAD(P)H-dependent FMN reductase